MHLLDINPVIKFCETWHHAVGSIGTLNLARVRIRYIHYSLSNEWVHAYLECGVTALRKVRDRLLGVDTASPGEGEAVSRAAPPD
jgi:hypothetical protein